MREDDTTDLDKSVLTALLNLCREKGYRLLFTYIVFMSLKGSRYLIFVHLRWQILSLDADGLITCTEQLEDYFDRVGIVIRYFS